jgi:hypothetical protein
MSIYGTRKKRVITIVEVFYSFILTAELVFYLSKILKEVPHSGGLLK